MKDRRKIAFGDTGEVDTNGACNRPYYEGRYIYEEPDTILLNDRRRNPYKYKITGRKKPYTEKGLKRISPTVI